MEKSFTNVLVASETNHTLLGEFFFCLGTIYFKSIWMCKCCLPVPLEIKYRPSYKGPFIRQEYIEFYTPVCTDINVLQYMYIYIYIHTSVVEMKQKNNHNVQIHCIFKQFLPTNATGKSISHEKKNRRCLRRHLWMSLIGKEKRRLFAANASAEGPGIITPIFLDQEKKIYWGGVPGCL